MFGLANAPRQSSRVQWPRVGGKPEKYNLSHEEDIIREVRGSKPSAKQMVNCSKFLN